ncbi:MAG: hypothetical protein AB8G17_18025 [Gammaproteobacteria bacterium]
MLLISNNQVNRSFRSTLPLIALVALSAWLMPTVLAQRVTAPPLLTPDAVQPLERKNGYVLLQLDVSGVAPSMEIAQISQSASRMPAADASVPRGAKRMQIDLTDRKKGLYLMQLAPGWYQITQVNAPYYNLPFQVDTGGEVRWRFVVQHAKTSYAGLLRINKERSRDSVNVTFLNRIATAHDDIRDQLGPVLAAAPLVMGRGLRDDFLIDFRRTEDAP